MQTLRQTTVVLNLNFHFTLTTAYSNSPVRCEKYILKTDRQLQQ